MFSLLRKTHKLTQDCVSTAKWAFKFIAAKWISRLHHILTNGKSENGPSRKPSISANKKRETHQLFYMFILCLLELCAPLLTSRCSDSHNHSQSSQTYVLGSIIKFAGFLILQYCVQLTIPNPMFNTGHKCTCVTLVKYKENQQMQLKEVVRKNTFEIV